VRFPPFRDVALPNGMTLLLVENHEQPTLSVSLSFRAARRTIRSGKRGPAALVAELLTKGTPTRGRRGDRGGDRGRGRQHRGERGRRLPQVSTDVLSDHADSHSPCLGDVTRRATSPMRSVELARTRFLSSLEVELSAGRQRAGRAFQKEITQASVRPKHSAAAYRAITRNDVAGFAGRRIPSCWIAARNLRRHHAAAGPRARDAGVWHVARAAAPAPAFPPPGKRRTDILLVQPAGLRCSRTS